MNTDETIRMAQEVGIFTPDLMCATVTLDMVGKLTELIARECMWKIMNRKEEAIDNDWDVDEAMSAAISDISEHFGVEE
jgi:hypothetical protein